MNFKNLIQVIFLDHYYDIGNSQFGCIGVTTKRSLKSFTAKFPTTSMFTETSTTLQLVSVIFHLRVSNSIPNTSFIFHVPFLPPPYPPPPLTSPPFLPLRFLLLLLTYSFLPRTSFPLSPSIFLSKKGKQNAD